MGHRTEQEVEAVDVQAGPGLRKRIVPCLVKLLHADDKIRSQWRENRISSWSSRFLNIDKLKNKNKNLQFKLYNPKEKKTTTKTQNMSYKIVVSEI